MVRGRARLHPARDGRRGAAPPSNGCRLCASERRLAPAAPHRPRTRFMTLDSGAEVQWRRIPAAQADVHRVRGPVCARSLPGPRIPAQGRPARPFDRSRHRLDGLLAGSTRVRAIDRARGGLNVLSAGVFVVEVRAAGTPERHGQKEDDARVGAPAGSVADDGRPRRTGPGALEAEVVSAGRSSASPFGPGDRTAVCQKMDARSESEVGRPVSAGELGLVGGFRAARPGTPFARDRIASCAPAQFRWAMCGGRYLRTGYL